VCPPLIFSVFYAVLVALKESIRLGLFRTSGACYEITLLCPPSQFFPFSVRSASYQGNLRDHLGVCVSVSRLFFVFCAVRIVSGQLTRSPWCLCVCFPLILCFLCCPHRIKATYEITLVSVCLFPPYFLFSMPSVSYLRKVGDSFQNFL
jgi:hypothetical protein